MSELLRTLRQRDLVAVTINAIIGAGIFGLPSRLYALTGPWSLAAVLACALFAGLIVLCFAEVASRFRDTGGPYLYARKAFGPAAAFNIGWLMWLARVSAFAANANLLLSYLATFGVHVESGVARIAFLCLLATTLGLVNYLGIRNAAIVNHLFTGGKLIPLAIFIAVGVFAIVPSRLVLTQVPSTSDFSAAVLLLVYAFTGFEMATIPGGEMRNPERALPRALLTAVGIVAFVYISLQAVCIGTLPQLAKSARPLADASQLFLGTVGSRLIVAGIVVSIIGNLHITLLTAARIPFAMAESGQLPRVFGHTQARYRSPDIAIAFTCACMLLLTIALTFVGALAISTVARLIVYMSTCGALLVLRRGRAPQASFRVPAGVPIAVTALCIALWLLAHAPRQEWSAVLTLIFVINTVYLLFTRRRSHTSAASDPGTL